jgi:hypothetical protein
MALQPFPECGHQVSDRAASCPDCGAPVGAGRRSQPEPSIEAWAVSRLKAGSPRRPVVEEIVRAGDMPRSDADALVKRLEAALVLERPAYLVKIAAGIGTGALILMLVFVVIRLLVV